MWTVRRDRSREAPENSRALPTQKKATLHPKPRRGLSRRDHQGHRAFTRYGLLVVFQTLSHLVRTNPPPFRVREAHTRGRPPTDPRDAALFVLIRALEGWSFDTTFAHLTAVPGLPQLLGFRRVPHPSTVVGLLDRIPPIYFEGLLQQLNLRLLRAFPEPWNLAGDSTGECMLQYLRWRDQVYGKEGRRRDFVKLHVLLVTRAQGPWFAAIHATPSNVNDVSELGALLTQVPSQIAVGNVALDKGYQSRHNAQIIEDRGGRPVMDLRSNVIHALSQGSPGWKRAVLARRDGRAFRCRYRRRGVIEGVFGAFKKRFGERVRCHQLGHQIIELLARGVMWNVLAVAYHHA